MFFVRRREKNVSHAMFFWSDESDMENFYFESLPENTANVNLTLGKTDKSGKNS